MPVYFWPISSSGARQGGGGGGGGAGPHLVSESVYEREKDLVNGGATLDIRRNP